MRRCSPAYARRVIPALHPRYWGVHALGILAVAAAVALGIWQWNVGDGRKALQANQYAHAEPAAIGSVLSPGASFSSSEFGRRVRVTGQWVPNSTVFVETGGSPRYWVATAVRSGDSSIYVVRGAYDSQRADCCGMSPKGPPPPVDIVGWLQPDQSSSTPAQGRVLPVMSNALAAPFVPTSLLDGYVIASTPDGWMTAVPEPQLPKADFWTGLRNWLYAFEWWFFGCFAAFIWWRQIRELTAAHVPSEA